MVIYNLFISFHPCLKVKHHAAATRLAALSCAPGQGISYHPGSLGGCDRPQRPTPSSQGTEHFLSDIHGEHEAFHHVLRTGSGSIRRKIEEIFQDTLSEPEKRTLATLIYYPEQKLPLLLESVADPTEWCRTTLWRLLHLCRVVAGKYTRTSVIAMATEPVAAIIDELLQASADVEDKHDYYHSLVETILATGTANLFITTLAELIQRLTVARLISWVTSTIVVPALTGSWIP